METQCLVHCRTLLSARVVFFVATLAIITLARTATLDAQTVNKDANPALPGDAAVPSPDKSIPADHYDPDDVKTYADVLVENRDVVIRGRQFTVHFYRSRAEGPVIPAIYACGDGGWRGLAPRTAEELAHMGFAVAGPDSKVYLPEFSSLENSLTTPELAPHSAGISPALR